ncbi:DUF262 domain-containing protein [Nitratireductor sp. L15S-10]|uniref:DUF262 domain-containing protein n=1 Tax=Nitratireductor sp. L15S-10 TaxID=3034028 RepID=UPI003857CFB2
MQINSNNYSIIELLNMLERRELIVNTEYQRGSGIWPQGPSSYFIDTIIEKFPFPKIYMYETIDRTERIAKKEIVDGQQRINTIKRFYDNEFALGSDSRYAGLKFDDLNEEVQSEFLSYSVSVDVIRSAQRSEILQMFRRMNAYTLPLNEAEKRHSSFQGKFKWFINDLADELNEFFVEFGVFTSRQIVRMSDAALISDCIISIEKGIISSNPTDFRSIYRAYDDEFPNESSYHKMLSETFEFIVDNFEPLRKTFMMKPYALHSLVTALIHSRYGIPSIEQEWNTPRTGKFAADPAQARESLLELAQAHEAKELEGKHALYVWGCMSTTDRKSRRTARVAAILRILGAVVPDHVDANLA